MLSPTACNATRFSVYSTQIPQETDLVFVEQFFLAIESKSIYYMNYIMKCSKKINKDKMFLF